MSSSHRRTRSSEAEPEAVSDTPDPLWRAWNRSRTKVVATADPFGAARMAAIRAGEAEPHIEKMPTPRRTWLLCGNGEHAGSLSRRVFDIAEVEFAVAVPACRILAQLALLPEFSHCSCVRCRGGPPFGGQGSRSSDRTQRSNSWTSMPTRTDAPTICRIRPARSTRTEPHIGTPSASVMSYSLAMSSSASKMHRKTRSRRINSSRKHSRTIDRSSGAMRFMPHRLPPN